MADAAFAFYFINLTLMYLMVDQDIDLKQEWRNRDHYAQL